MAKKKESKRQGYVTNYFGRYVRKLEKELKEWKESPYAKVGEYHQKWLGEK